MVIPEKDCSLIHIIVYTKQITYGQDSSNYYTAAVVEYSPTYVRNDALSTLEKNTDAYIEYIEKASKQVRVRWCATNLRNVSAKYIYCFFQNADIIVFPEDGLTSLHMPGRPERNSWSTVIPSALNEYVPCTGNYVGVSDVNTPYLCTTNCHSLETFVHSVPFIVRRH